LSTRYLIGDGGSRIDSRGMACLYNTGLMLASMVIALLGVIAAAVLEQTSLVVIGLSLASLLFLGGVIWAWVQIFRSGGRLNDASKAWLAGDLQTTYAKAREALPGAFRADFRTKAYHQLGLCAEGNGEFGDALQLFDLAQQSLPSMAAPLRRNRALTLIHAHRALALAALGRPDEARLAQQQAEQAFAAAAKKSVTDALLDDGDWGLGSISANAVIESMEAKRDHHALLALVATRNAYAGGATQQVLQLAEQWRAWFQGGLLPREQLLANRMEAHVMRSFDPARADALYRPADAHAEQWVARALGQG
jgi:tetratricopeptide (TPR) repeat protein